MSLYVNYSKGHVDVDNILIYSDTKVQCTISCRAQELKEVKRNESSLAIDAMTPKYSEEYDGCPICIDTMLDIRNARKANFSKDDLFIMKRPPEYSYDTYKTDLYVPVRLCKILSSGTGVKMDSKDEVCYNDWVEIEFDPCFTVKFNRCKVEKFPIDYEPQEPYEWSSNYGSVARPCYYHYKNIKTGERAGIIKRWCEIEQHHGYVMKVWEAGPYKKITYSPERQRLMKMSNEIKEKLNMNLTYYDLERLTSLYNITEKEV